MPYEKKKLQREHAVLPLLKPNDLFDNPFTNQTKKMPLIITAFLNALCYPKGQDHNGVTAGYYN